MRSKFMLRAREIVELHKFLGIERFHSYFNLAAGNVEKRLLQHITFNGIL